jgi:hypothetical protein
VYYQKGSVTEEEARAMLGTAEEQWALQIDQMGFSQPWRVIDGVVEQGLKHYVYGATPTDGIEPIANIPSTPQTDCASVAAISKEFAPQSYRTYGISHVFNHAAALGGDCIEPMLGVELLQEATGAVGGDPGIAAVFRENVTQFQRTPERPLVIKPVGQNDMYYLFGAALFRLRHRRPLPPRTLPHQQSPAPPDRDPAATPPNSRPAQ